MLLQFVECGLAIWVMSLALRAWRSTAPPAGCHPFDLPDREFTAGRLLCKIEPQFRVLDGEQCPSVASSDFALLDPIQEFFIQHQEPYGVSHGGPIFPCSCGNFVLSQMKLIH